MSMPTASYVLELRNTPLHTLYPHVESELIKWVRRTFVEAREDSAILDVGNLYRGVHAKDRTRVLAWAKSLLDAGGYSAIIETTPSTPRDDSYTYLRVSIPAPSSGPGR